MMSTITYKETSFVYHLHDTRPIPFPKHITYASTHSLTDTYLHGHVVEQPRVELLHRLERVRLCFVGVGES